MTRSRSFALLALTLSTSVATLAQAAPAAKMANGMWVDNAGMTLYTFDRDVAASGKSMCNGPCATLWPPAPAAADARPDGDFTIVVRDDGARQWAYKGKPVYTYSGDKKSGETTGDNFKDSWHVIK
jgi:predicted lipoprotein with Yx(FWY)xxD motif